MSSVVLDAGIPPSQAPALYAETLICGTGGVIAGTDPTVGVKFSRQYGPLGAQTELLAQVTKDLSLPPNTAGVPFGGVVNCAGIRMSNTGGPPENGTALAPLQTTCGVATMTLGVCQVFCSAASTAAPNASLVFYVANNAANSCGILRLTDINNNSFIIRSFLPGTGTVNTLDSGVNITWMLINPNWAS